MFFLGVGVRVIVIREVVSAVGLDGGSGWAYAALTIATLLPLVPGEVAVIAAGALAAQGTLELAAVILAAAIGSCCGDMLSYGCGRWPVRRMAALFAGDRHTRVVTWTATRVRRGAVSALVAARFLPGGRTAAAVTAGLVRLSVRRFVLAVVTGACGWAVVMALLGYAGGRSVEYPAIGMLVAFVVAVAGASAVVLRRYGRGSR